MRFPMTALALAAALACGCQRQAARPPEYQTLAQDPSRDTETARRENGRAIGLIAEGKLDEAQEALKTALAADLFYGPAHNNLGVVHQKQEQHYVAAWEFQYAARLMPHSPEPRSNLGLVYETVGRLGEAESWYDKALALQPDNPALLGSLARVLVREGRRDEKTFGLLKDLALKATDPEWSKWARDQLAVMGRPEARTAEPASPAPPSTPVPEQPASAPDAEPK